ncbi:MAG: portal protein [Verrucomicrobiota bacterium JB024]|nr:portal protein [Verrucomicrobiota bacterium JB024]
MSDDKAKEIIRRTDALRQADYNVWLPLWQACVDRFIPSVGHVISSGRGERKNLDGENRPGPIDKIGVLSCRRYASGMSSRIAPSNQRWSRLKDTRPALKDNQEVKEYWDKTSESLSNYLNASNFETVKGEVFEQLGAVGTCCILFTKGTKTLFNFQIIPIGTYEFSVDHENNVVEVARWFEMTPVQAEAMNQTIWGGKAKFGKSVAKALEPGAPDELKHQKQKWLHSVRKRAIYDPQARNDRNMPWESCYVHVEDMQTVHEGGYTSCPYIIARAIVRPSEKWGRSNGMEVIDEQDLTSRTKRATVLAVEEQVNPRTFKKASHKYAIRNSPGGITIIDNDRDVIDRETKSNPQYGRELLLMQHEIVQKFFHIDLFEMFDSLLAGGKPPTMTLGEFRIRFTEKLLSIAPEVGRSLNEFLTPVHLRAFDIMNQAGVLDLPPAIMGRVADFKVEYTNSITIALKALKNQDIIAAFEDIGMVAAQAASVAPGKAAEVMDNFDFDKIIRELYENSGAVTEGLFSTDEVSAVRMMRAQQAQLAQLSELANKGADTINKLPEGAQEDIVSQFQLAMG